MWYRVKYRIDRDVKYLFCYCLQGKIDGIMDNCLVFKIMIYIYVMCIICYVICY